MSIANSRLAELYTACLQGFSLELVQEIRADESLAKALDKVIENVWHPTSEQLDWYGLGALSGLLGALSVDTIPLNLTRDIEYHLYEDKCQSCRKKVGLTD